jgi:hypothetical protein
VREFIDCCANGSDYACDIVAATVGMIFPVGNVSRISKSRMGQA